MIAEGDDLNWDNETYFHSIVISVSMSEYAAFLASGMRVLFVILRKKS